MTKKILLAIFFALALATIASAQFSNNGITVRGAIERKIIKRGAAAKATVILDIPSGIHTNSNRPSGEFALPTTVKIKGSGVKIGTIIYPRGKNKRFQFADEMLNVYDGRTTFNFIVSVPKNYREKEVKILAVVDYQACTDEVCFPPNKQQVTLTAKVR